MKWINNNIGRECIREYSYRFIYKTNTYVNLIEKEYLGYDCYTDKENFEVTVFFHDGQKFSWKSNVLDSYGDGLYVDSKGRFLFGCSLNGLYCLDIKTGKKIWQKRKMSMSTVINEDDTLACQWHKQLFLLDLDGNITKDLKTNYDCSVFYIEDDKFLIRIDKQVWSIVSSHIDRQYDIPNQAFLEVKEKRGSGNGIRFATFRNNALIVKYWTDQEQTIDLTQYKIKSQDTP